MDGFPLSLDAGRMTQTEVKTSKKHKSVLLSRHKPSLFLDTSSVSDEYETKLLCFIDVLLHKDKNQRRKKTGAESFQAGQETV